jgi:hypothetical protein
MEWILGVVILCVILGLIFGGKEGAATGLAGAIYLLLQISLWLLPIFLGVLILKSCGAI